MHTYVTDVWPRPLPFLSNMPPELRVISYIVKNGFKSKHIWLADSDPYVTTSCRTHLELQTKCSLEKLRRVAIQMRNGGLNSLAYTRILRTVTDTGNGTSWNKDVNVLTTWECVCALFRGGAGHARGSQPPLVSHKIPRGVHEDMQGQWGWGGLMQDRWGMRSVEGIRCLLEKNKKHTYSDKICRPKSRHWPRRSEAASASVPRRSRSSTRKTNGVRLESMPLRKAEVRCDHGYSLFFGQWLIILVVTWLVFIFIVIFFLKIKWEVSALNPHPARTFYTFWKFLI